MTHHKIKEKRRHSEVRHQPVYFTFKQSLLYQKPTNTSLWWFGDEYY